MTIYVDTPLEPEQKEWLKTQTPLDTLRFGKELAGSEERLKALLQADILFGNPRPVEWLQQAANLKWIQLYSTGFEYYSGISTSAVVTNMQDYYSQPCAETILAGILALYRDIAGFTLCKEKKQWVGAPIRSGLRLLHHRKVIILGAGHIGRCMAKILSGFDAEIRFFSRTAPDASCRTAHDLHNNIHWADIIIGCLPGTAETKGLFTPDMIRAMQPHALFCNVGRGNLVADEQALAEALMNRTIGGAVLDVTALEPILPDSRLWDCPNTILTQHSGGGQESEMQGILQFFLENLENFRQGRPLLNRIELAKGY